MFPVVSASLIAREFEKLGNKVISPLKEILGIGNEKDKSCHKGAWNGVREFYVEKNSEHERPLNNG